MTALLYSDLSISPLPLLPNTVIAHTDPATFFFKKKKQTLLPLLLFPAIPCHCSLHCKMTENNSLYSLLPLFLRTFSLQVTLFRLQSLLFIPLGLPVYIGHQWLSCWHPWVLTCQTSWQQSSQVTLSLVEHFLLTFYGTVVFRFCYYFTGHSFSASWVGFFFCSTQELESLLFSNYILSLGNLSSSIASNTIIFP